MVTEGKRSVAQAAEAQSRTPFWKLGAAQRQLTEPASQPNVLASFTTASRHVSPQPGRIASSGKDWPLATLVTVARAKTIENFKCILAILKPSANPKCW